ncbi:hypothetical protein BDR06DRAFT_532717 [Suillus hirtellus]|nr:hypothetical protein BDR06DRAFT_532717 [Suillus hirtellus]
MSCSDVVFSVHACQFIRRFSFRQRYNPERIISISLPLEAIGALAVDKQLIMPVIRILIGEAFTCIGFMHVEDKVLRFFILASCLPLASMQVTLTRACSDTNLAVFLLPRLILVSGVMTILTTFTFLFAKCPLCGIQCMNAAQETPDLGNNRFDLAPLSSPNS